MRNPIVASASMFIFAFYFLIERTVAECAAGCLKCATDGTCIQCDYFNSYFPNSGGCLKTSITSCVMPEISGSCLICNNSTKLINGACQKMEKTEELLGCIDYITKTSCKTCERDYYVDNGKCIKTKAQISNCEIHSNNGLTCLKCTNNTILAADQKSCIKSPGTENCRSYSTVGCKQCKNGYFLSPKRYLVDLANLNSTSQKISLGALNRYLQTMKLSTIQSFEGTCIATEVSNCLSYADYNRCQKCMDKFYLTVDNKCLPYPAEPVPFCEVYLNSTACQMCQNRYFMSDVNTCSSVTEILNCESYSRDTDKVCLQCSTNYYTDRASCIARKVSQSISNCLTLDASSDSCQVCSNGFEINSDGTACLTSVPFCQTYEKTASSLKCTKCLNTHYLNSESKCLKATAENCKVAAGETTCAECENGFYLNGTICSPQPLKSVLNCDKMGSSSLNDCQTCSDINIKIPIDGICRPVPKPINNCYKYSSSTTCESCNPKTSYSKEGACIGAYVSNCALYNPSLENSCQSCKVDYSTGTIYVPYPKQAANNKCVAGDPNIIQNCWSYEAKDDAEYCSICANKFYPFLMPSANLVYCVPKTFYLLPSQASLLTDCRVFNSRGGKCVECSSGKVIGSDGVCTSECKSNEFLYAISHDTNNTDVAFRSFLECSATAHSISTSLFSSTPLPCYKIVEGSAENEGLCGGCRANQVGVIDWSKNLVKATLLSLYPIPNLVKYNYYNRILTFNGCVSNQVTYNDQTTTIATRIAKIDSVTLVNLDNSRAVSLLGSSDRYGIKACRFGYSGQIISDFDANGYMIKKCEPIPSCNATVYFNGLGSLPGQEPTTTNTPPIDFYVSCHQCTGEMIPTYARALGDLNDVTPNIKAGRFGSYGIPLVSQTTTVPYKATTKEGWTTSCQKPGLGKTLIPFCAVQEINLNLVLTDYSTSTNLNNPVCVACAPGYKATVQSNNYMVSSCTKIANCMATLSTTFNKCSICSKGFALKYSSAAPDGLSDYEECIDTPNVDFNCLIANNGVTPTVCVVCMAGYTLNADGYCDIVNTFSCEKHGYYQKFSKRNLRSLTFPYSGCSECAAESIGIIFDTAKRMCVLSSQLYGGVVPEKSAFIIQNCQLYSIDKFGNIICSTCSSDYVISLAKTKCFKSIARIRNCDAYTNDGTNCGRCSNGYYLNSVSICTLGTIPNCVVYSGEKKCETCASGFIAVGAQGGRAVCIALPSTNCQQYDAANLAIGLMTCSLCDTNYFYEKNTATLGKLPLNYCAAIPPITNCLAYNNLNDISSAPLTCKICKDGYFWNGKECTVRSRPLIASCAQLSYTSDNCEKCTTGYTVENTGLCAAFPEGISGCEVYKNNKLCTQCKSQMYLSQNKCISVPIEARIENCLYYDSQLQCVKCNPKYVNTSPKTCGEAVATNCATYTSINQCATCPSGYGIIREKEATNCVQISIANCMTPDDKSEGPKFKCKVCNTSFYLTEDSACVAVPKLIDNCAIYNNSTTCSFCFEGFVLSQDMKSCLNDAYVLNQVDSNCLNSYVLPNPICNMCNERYIFSMNATTGNFSCVACDQSLDDGCSLCNPNNSTLCLACSPGFFQKTDGSCELNEPLLTSIQNETVTTSASIFETLAMFLLLILSHW